MYLFYVQKSYLCTQNGKVSYRWYESTRGKSEHRRASYFLTGRHTAKYDRKCNRKYTTEEFFPTLELFGKGEKVG